MNKYRYKSMMQNGRSMHKISERGIEVDKAKVDGIEKMLRES